MLTESVPGRPRLHPSDGRKLARHIGLLRNSTILAAQKSGLEQCSQKAPDVPGKLKRRPDGHWGAAAHGPCRGESMLTAVTGVQPQAAPGEKKDL